MKIEDPLYDSPAIGALRHFAPLLLYLGFAVVIGAVVYAVDYVPALRLRDVLKSTVPVVLAVDLMLVLFGLLLCAKDLADAIVSLNGRQWTALLAVVLVAGAVAGFAVPRTHRIYYDEDIYANVGQTIAETGDAAYANYAFFEHEAYNPIWTEYNKEPAGWPFVLSFFFRFFGTDEIYLFVANNLLFVGSLLIVFFITRRLTGGFFPALAAAAVYGLIPHNLIWANTGAVEPSAAFFAAAVVLVTVVFLESGRYRQLFLLSVLIPLACYMRPESMMIFLWAVAAILVFRPKVFARLRSWGGALIAAAFLAPMALHLYAVSGESWGAEGARFARSFAAANLSVNGPYYFNNVEFPAAFAVLALLGLVMGKSKLRLRLLMLFWFALFWSIFLYFYAGSYNYGADERFALLSFAPLSVLAGAGLGRLRDMVVSSVGKTRASVVAIAVTAAFALPFLPQVLTVGQEAWASRLDHHYAHRFAENLPARSVTLTHNPTLFLLWGRGAAQAYAAVAAEETVKDMLRRFPGQVYFYYDYWCNTPSVRNRRLCGEIMARWDLEPVDSATEKNYTYALYRILGKKAP